VYVSQQVAPLLIVGETTLIGISTLLSSTNFYTRLLRLRDKTTNQPLFTVLAIELACAACKNEGKSAECIHLLHLIPRYLSLRHPDRIRLNTDRGMYS
jgi:hypothetical protein